MQIHPRLSRSRSRICSRRNSALKDRAGSSPTIKTEPVEKVPDSIASSVIEPAIQMPAKMPPVAVKESLAVTPRPASAVPVTKEKPSTKKATPGRPASTPANMVVDKAERASKEPKTEPGLKLRNPKHRAIEPEPLIVVKQEMKMEVDAEEPELAPEPAIPLSKEKKKRVVPPVQKKDVPVVKGGNVDCLANTRQKRVIKERSKTIVDSIKARNKSSAVAEKEVPKKVTMAKTKVKEEASVTTEALKKEDAAGPSSIDVKMKGRKRKEKSEVFDEHFELMTLPPCKTISLGDKVKVYYAPNREGKITSYEAKVISTEEENGETLYFVHYIGWNARYDEWIRADRIADNVSWIAGRSSKKATQTPTPKSAKKAKNTITSEIKTEAKASCSKEGVSTSSAHSSSKDHHGNWQGSVGRSTTPSSIAPSHVRSEGAVQKRPKTRATFSKKGEIKLEPESNNDEVAEDVGSEAEDSKHAIVPLLERECTSSRQSKTKKTAAGSKDESALTSVEVKEEKYEESDEEEVDDGECEGMDLIDPKSEPEPIPSSKNDPTNAVKEEEVVEVKAEVDDVDEEDDDCYEKVEEGYEDDDDEDDPELLIQNSIVKGEYSDVSLGRGTPLLGSDAPTADSGSKDNTFHSVEEFPAGKSRRETDSDAGGVSAVEEISLTEVENEIKEEDGDDENNKEYDEGDLELLIQNSIVEEEYSDDSLGRGMTFLGFDAPTADSGSKDNTFHSVEEFPAGKSRRETDSDAGGVSAVEEISLTEVENEIKEEDGDDENNKEYDEGDLELLIQNSIVEEEYSDDSLGRGMTFLGFDAPTADSGSNDNTSQFLADKSRRETNSDAGGITAAEEISLTEVKNKITCQSPSELLSKDGSSPESTPTIQTCEEAFGTICWSPLRAATLDCRHIGLLENIALLRFQHRPESHEDDDSEDQLVIYERDSYNSNAICDTTAMEFIEESDIKTGPEDESQPETSVMDACPDAAQPDDSPAIKVEPVKEVDSGEAAVVEEDEDNLESLICEETIPSSPPSQVDSLCQMEKKRLAIEEEDDMFKNEPQLSSGAREAADTKNLVQVVRVNRCPSTTLESNESSRPSPPRECSETTRIQNERKTDEVKTDATTSGEPSFKKNTGKGPTDGRSKKVEAKTPAKRGRKAKKKFENAATTRKTYSKHVKNQGSEIVDGIYDGSGSSGRGDSSSGTPHPYRRNFLIPQDKLITMDVAQRITTIAQAMQDLRMTYRSHKTELAAIDKLRKRTRRC